MTDYLKGKSVVEWNYLEDLALQKPDDSPEFKVLLMTKNLHEIQVRRSFLNAVPIFEEISFFKEEL